MSFRMIKFTSIFRMLLLNSLSKNSVTSLAKGNRHAICIFRIKLMGMIVVLCHTYNYII